MNSRLLTSIIDFLPDATFAIDRKGRVIAWNKAMERMTGVERADMQGNADYAYSVPFYGKRRPILIDLVGSENGDTERLYDYVKRQGETACAEAHVPSLNNGRGAYLWGTATRLFDNEGNCQGAIETIRDITQRKMIEEELKFRNILLATQQESSLDGILVMDGKGRILSFNKQFAHMFDILSEAAQDNSEKLVFRSVLEKVVDSHKFKKALWHLFMHNFETGREEVALKDGRTFDCYSAPMAGPNGEYYGRVWYFRDITPTKKAKQALEESEEKFRLLFEKSADPILLLDGDRYIDCNEAAVRLMRCGSKERLIGLTPRDISPERQPDGRLSSEKSRELVNVALEQGATRFEWMRRVFDGEDVWTESSLTIIPIQGKKIMHAVWRDIRERKLAETALRRAEEKYHTIIENAVEGIFQATPDGHYLSVNPAYARMFGYGSPGEFIETVTDMSRQVFVDAEQHKKMMVMIEEKGILEAFEAEFYRKDGSTVWAGTNARAVRDTDGKILFCEGTTEDITARKISEIRLTRETQFNRTLIQDSPAFFVAVVPDGKILLMNRSLLHVLGYEDGEVTGKDFISSFVPSEEKEKVSQIFETLCVKRQSTMNEHHILGKNGKRRLVEWHGRPVLDGKGGVAFLFGVGIDITGRKQAEEALKKRETELEIKSRNLEEVNTTLKVLLRQRENDKTELEESILSNVKVLVLPYIDKLKRSRLEASHLTYVDMLETNLNDIISPFLQKINSNYLHLTPTEVEVANLIKGGKSTKEIGSLLHISPGTVKFHRNNIRKKLGLKKEKKANLRSYLLSLS
jgi:PAS domain S-box-containing protein